MHPPGLHNAISQMMWRPRAGARPASTPHLSRSPGSPARGTSSAGYKSCARKPCGAHWNVHARVTFAGCSHHTPSVFGNPAALCSRVMKIPPVVPVFQTREPSRGAVPALEPAAAIASSPEAHGSYFNDANKKPVACSNSRPPSVHEK